MIHVSPQLSFVSKRRLQFSAFESNILFTSILNHMASGFLPLIAPLIGKEFFPHATPAMQLVYSFMLMLTSFLVRPLAIFNSYWAIERFGVFETLKKALIGTAISSACMISTLLIQAVGAEKSGTSTGEGGERSVVLFLCIILLFIIGRTLHGFSMRIEGGITAALLPSFKTRPESYKISSYLETSSMIGLALASCMGGIVTFYTPSYWQLCFVLILALQGLLLWHRIIYQTSYKALSVNISTLNSRNSSLEITKKSREAFESSLIENSSAALLMSKATSLQLSFLKFFKQLWLHKKIVSLIALITGVSHLTYIFPFVLFNSLLPILYPQLSASSLLWWNSILLGLDIMLIPLWARVCKSLSPILIFNISGMMLICLFLSFGFILRPGVSLYEVIILRIVLIVAGVLFMTPQLYYFQKITHSHLCSENVFSSQVLLLGTGKALGDGICGRLTPLICALLIEYVPSSSMACSGGLAALVCIGALWMIKRFHVNPKKRMGTA